MEWTVIICVLLVVCSLECGSFMVDTKSKCVQQRARGMYGADCSDLDLRDIPQYLSKDIEVLDMTYNRIRELYNSSFVNYSYLRFLYLEDNSISYIETATFAPIPDLEVLSMGMNSLHQVPDAIYSLPVLNKLRLNNNPFSGGLIHFMDPLRSVEHLDISNCKLTEIPQLEALPRLLSLNISYNAIKSVNVDELAPLCRLQMVYLQGNKALFSNWARRCDCPLLASWTQTRHIRTLPALSGFCQTALPAFAPFDNSTCFTNETLAAFQESEAKAKSCEAQVAEYGSGPIRLKGSLLWTIGIITACAVLLVCFGSVYFVRRRQRHFQHDNVSEVESITKSRS